GQADDPGHDDVATFVDQDEEHDADTEGPAEELRVDQRRQPGGHDREPQPLELEEQETDIGELAEDEREESENPRRQPAVAPSAVARLGRDIGLNRAVRAVAVVGPAGRGILVWRIQTSHHFELAHRLGLSITSNGVSEPAVTPRSAPLPARGG